MGDLPALDGFVAGELDQTPSEAARILSDEILRRHGDAVAAVVFYGSCLRGQTREGVLDFYALVDSYRAAYGSRLLAGLNALLPPNVFFVELESPIGTLRSKVAVISSGDFLRATSPDARRASIWARFCQPAVLVYARDAEARATVVAAASGSITTALLQGIALLQGEGETRFDWEALWQNTLAETYAAEMRPESPETIRSVYAAAPARFESAARARLDALAARGALRWRAHGDGAVVEIPAARRRQLARSWRRRRPLRKALHLLGLLKSAATFGDWLPYVLWKLE
ncbi:MAG: hypothetical protein ACE5FL_04290, partial [Myxococcota bacterium]